MGNLPCVTAASYGGGYRIHLRFDDGVEKTVDFRCWLQGPVFEPLLDEAAFRQFRIEGGTIAWASGADIAPEALHAAPSSEEAA